MTLPAGELVGAVPDAVAEAYLGEDGVGLVPVDAAARELQSSPAAHCSRVDVPDPEGPITAVKLPAVRPRVTPSSAVTALSSGVRPAIGVAVHTPVDTVRHRNAAHSDKRSTWEHRPLVHR